MKKIALAVAGAALALSGAGVAQAAPTCGGSCDSGPYDGPSNGGPSGMLAEGGFPTHYGDVNLRAPQTGLVNTNGAPLVHADLRCAAPWQGGVIAPVIGSDYAACNTAPIDQSDRDYQSGNGSLLGLS